MRQALLVTSAGAGVASLALAAFGLWGTRTASGRRTFDEMAGIVPGFALYAAAPALLLVGLGIAAYLYASR